MDTVTIPLLARNDSTIRGYAIIDAADASLVAPFRWRYREGGYVYTRIKRNGRSHKLYIHRLIVSAPDGTDVDHRNSNPLDNRRSNLRVSTRAQNAQNQRKRTNNTTGYKGVAWERHKAKFSARIMANGKRVRLGLFNTAQDAAAAYDMAARQLHGEYALTNNAVA